MGKLGFIVLGIVITPLLAACAPPATDAVASPDDTPTPVVEATAIIEATPTPTATSLDDSAALANEDATPTPTAPPEHDSAVAGQTPTASASHDPTPTPTAPVVEGAEHPTPTPAVAQGGDGQASGCVSNPNPTFTVAHTDLDKVSFISPMIVPSGNWLKNRSYFVIKNDPSTGDAFNVPVHAPIDMVLTGITRYMESAMDHQGNLLEQDQLDLEFQVSCEVSIGFDHVKTLVGEGAEVTPAEAVWDTRDAQKQVRVEYQAGDLIGYTKGTSVAHTWDFIMESTLSTIQYANQERYETMGDLVRMRQAVCPYDYYEESIRAQYLALFGGWAGLMTGATTCLGSPDVLGSIAGGWFGSPYAGDAFMPADWALAVVHTADDRVEINDASNSVRTDGSHSTHMVPGLVTTEHCYQDYNTPAKHVYLKMLAVDQVAYAFGQGTCPASFPSDSSIAYR